MSSFDMSAESFRKIGYQLVDLVSDLLEAERTDPVLTSASGEEIRALFEEPLPREGSSLEQVLSAYRDVFLTYNRRNGHPRFWGYVSSSADPVGVLADMLASAMNQNVTSWRSAPMGTEMERRVIHWLDEMVGFEGGGQGFLTSGGSAANTMALGAAVARAERPAGRPSLARSQLTLYVSKEAHLSLRKAARFLGIAEAHIRTIGIDEARRIAVGELATCLAADVQAGLVPAGVCASAGTANTGAIDPLEAVADVCKPYGVWFHIDGAYGALAAITDTYGWMSRAFRRADSLALDPHKWLYAPLDVGCLLFREAAPFQRAYAQASEYTAVARHDPIEQYAFFDHSLELSRRLRALKVWMILKVRGVAALAAMIEQNITLRRSLDARIGAEPRLEALGSDLSITCFRYVPDRRMSEEALNRLNRRILESLVQQGQLYMSPTTLDGRYGLRVCIVNFRTRQEDVDFLVEQVLRLGAQ